MAAGYRIKVASSGSPLSYKAAAAKVYFHVAPTDAAEPATCNVLLLPHDGGENVKLRKSPAALKPQASSGRHLRRRAATKANVAVFKKLPAPVPSSLPKQEQPAS